jgi:chromosomal replication initiation ATPase DnaA
MADGRGSGHQPDYYDLHDQRFLGDQRFVEQIDERIRTKREIKISHPRASFSKLVHLTAEAYGITERELVRIGRQRKLVKPRSMLVYVGREWAKASVKEIGRRLHRDPSVISRLYAAYAADRDYENEAGLAEQLRQ